MPLVAMQGIRGGCGCTSLVAGMAGALRQLGKRVLALDLCPDNMLGIHLGLALSDDRGWAAGKVDHGHHWFGDAYVGHAGIEFVPFGLGRSVCLTSASGLPGHCLENPLGDALADIGYAEDDWVLLDLPKRLPFELINIIGPVDLLLRVAEADAGCHVLLQRPPPNQARIEAGKRLLLVNRFQPELALQQDLWLLWRNHLGERMLPFSVHRDEHLAEAFACRQLIQQYRPDSLFCRDMLSLATWCIANHSRRPG